MGKQLGTTVEGQLPSAPTLTVAVIHDEIEVRMAFEDEAVRRLEKIGWNARPAYGEGHEHDQYVGDGDDGGWALIARVASVDREVVWDGAIPDATLDTMSDQFLQSRSIWPPIPEDAERTEARAIVEARLLDPSDTAVWVGRSEVMDPPSRVAAAKRVAQLVVDALKADLNAQ